MVAAVTHTDEQLSYCSLSINPVLGISLHMAFTLAQCMTVLSQEVLPPSLHLCDADIADALTALCCSDTGSRHLDARSKVQ